MMIKNLFIHMADESTNFLAEIYRGVPGKVIRDDTSVEEMNQLIAEHDRVVMMGHGSPSGLFGVKTSSVIGVRNVEALKNKDNIYIWCHASAFVRNYNLKGFSTGMFISEVGEAIYCGIKESSILQEKVTNSNDTFASLVREYIEQPTAEIYDHVGSYYNSRYHDHPVVAYNSSRLVLFT